MFSLKAKSSLPSLIKTSLMALVMSGVLSLYWTGMNHAVLGLQVLPELFLLWFHIWGESFVIALPTSLIVGPIIHHHVNSLTKSEC